MPLSPVERIGSVRGSQLFHSPITETDCAFGAQTAKCVAESPPASRKCAPSFSYSRLCVPSRKRYWSCPVRATLRSVTVGMGVHRVAEGDRGCYRGRDINFDYANGLRS